MVAVVAVVAVVVVVVGVAVGGSGGIGSGGIGSGGRHRGLSAESGSGSGVVLQWCSSTVRRCSGVVV